MISTIDTRMTWWYSRQVQMRLTKWTLALLEGRRYTVKLENEGTGFTDPVHRIIQANPTMFSKESIETQFRVTQGILAHEVGHALFTGDWEEQEDNILRELVNILEDEREERCICVYYPGITPAVRLLGKLCFKEMGSLSSLIPKMQAYCCCLGWRWAHREMEESEMLDQLEVGPAGGALWSKVRSLVEESWEAANTREVILLARRILEILEIRDSLRPLRPPALSSGGIPEKRDSAPLPRPKGARPGRTPGLGSLPEVEEFHSDTFSRPAPYHDIEEQAEPLARKLAEELKEPQPETALLPHDWRGRYSIRQELRTPESPCLYRQGIERAPRSMALYLLVDRSGSICLFEERVRVGIMVIYLAATSLAIPTGIGFFGGNSPGLDPVLKIVDVSPHADEEAKALIAGFSGETGNEFLDWGLKMAEEELSSRQERLKVLIVVHDGQPVYKSGGVIDWDLSAARIRAMERKGIVPIGLYLGNDGDDLKKLKLLFPRLVNCTGPQLPEKLGNLLRSLA